MKRRIRQNQWGNWKGYLGSRKVEDFGTDGQAAQEWAAGATLEKPDLSQPIKLRGPGFNVNADLSEK